MGSSAIYVFGGIVAAPDGRKPEHSHYLADLLRLDLQRKCWEHVAARGEVPARRAYSAMTSVGEEGDSQG